MPLLLEQAHIAKTLNMKMIHAILEAKRRGETITKTPFQKIIHQECKLEYIIYTDYQDKNHFTGYILDLDPNNPKEILNGRFVHKNGLGTRRSPDLTKDELKDLLDYYEIHNLDLWYRCHEAMN